VTDATEGEKDNIWNRLRRRKVVQWGIAYAAGAWGFLQGLEYVSSLLEWPAQLQKLTGLALLIGLPIVLVLAWYHGDRGEQRVTRVELAIVTLLFLIGGGLFWRYHDASQPQLATTTPTAASEPGATIADPRPSIAVLPFDNRSAQQDDTYFVDGIHDDILTQLSKVSGMRVISRTSVEQFRDTKLPIKNIAEQLGVAQILEGGVQRAGDRVRVTVQLIDAATDGHVWAENYDRELTAANIFAIQSEVATAIAAALKATLTADEKTRLSAIPTQNLEAWEAYQLGKQRMARRTSAALAQAERFFREALERDPEFALAHVGLADALTLQVGYSGKPAEATLAEAEATLAKAFQLDQNLAEAWASSGSVAQARAQDDTAERAFRRAIELNPNYAPAHQWLSLTLRGGTRLQEEHEHAQRAVDLDPLSAIAVLNLGHTLERLGRFDEAATRYRRVIEIDPQFPPAFSSLADLEAYGRNRFVEATPLLERAVALDAGNARDAASLALLRHDLGDIAEATQLIAALVERWPDDLFANAVAGIAAELSGDHKAAERHGRAALNAYSRVTPPLATLRNIDLRKGEAAAARSRYTSAYPELMRTDGPQVDVGNYQAAIDVALVLESLELREPAQALLDGGERAIRSLPRLGWSGYGVSDVQIYALRGDKAKALVALREAEKAGWRGAAWRYYRDIDPNLASIRDEPEFKAVFADIERDMARQRAELAKRPKDTPLDLGPSG